MVEHAEIKNRDKAAKTESGVENVKVCMICDLCTAALFLYVCDAPLTEVKEKMKLATQKRGNCPLNKRRASVNYTHTIISHQAKSSLQNVGLVLSPFQNPITSPVSPTHSLTPVTTAFAMPALVPLRARLLPSMPLLGPPTPMPEPLPNESGALPGVR